MYSIKYNKRRVCGSHRDHVMIGRRPRSSSFSSQRDLDLVLFGSDDELEESLAERSGFKQPQARVTKRRIRSGSDSGLMLLKRNLKPDPEEPSLFKDDGAAGLAKQQQQEDDHHHLNIIKTSNKRKSCSVQKKDKKKKKKKQTLTLTKRVVVVDGGDVGDAQEKKSCLLQDTMELEQDPKELVDLWLSQVAFTPNTMTHFIGRFARRLFNRLKEGLNIFDNQNWNELAEVVLIKECFTPSAERAELYATGLIIFVSETIPSNTDAQSPIRAVIVNKFMILLRLIVDYFVMSRQHQESDRSELEIALFLHLLSKSRKLGHLGVTMNGVHQMMNSIIAELTQKYPELIRDRIIRKMIRSWPDVGSVGSLLYMDIVDTFLHLCPVQALLKNPEVKAGLFKRLAQQLYSMNSQFANRAIEILGAPFVIINYVASDEQIHKDVAHALHTNSKTHWCDSIRSLCDELFDAMLDFTPQF